MNGKSIPSELADAPSLTSRVISFIKPKRPKVWLWCGGAAFATALLAIVEIRTSFVQSWIFTRTNARISFSLAEGRDSGIFFPRSAPFDDRRGYSKLGNFQSRLESQGYRVAQQARQSEALATLVSRGISPPYQEPPDTGMSILGARGVPLFRYAQSDFLFKGIDDIPPLLTKTLLFLENRDLDRPASSWQNPVIEWDRLLKASFFYIASKLHLRVPVQGGSTLAVSWKNFATHQTGARIRQRRSCVSWWARALKLTGRARIRGR